MVDQALNSFPLIFVWILITPNYNMQWLSEYDYDSSIQEEKDENVIS